MSELRTVPASIGNKRMRMSEEHVSTPPHVHGTWFTGVHDDCDLEGRHRHDIDGGLHFKSIAEHKQMMQRMLDLKDMKLAELMKR